MFKSIFNPLTPSSFFISPLLKGVFKGLVKGETIRFLRSNSSQDDYDYLNF